MTARIHWPLPSWRRMTIVTLTLGALSVPQGDTAWGQEQKTANLPLKKVVLFSSGVGFFEHLGQVEGNAKVELKFNVDDVNDLLKSMVVQDLDGGQISTVGYGSKDPITKTLRTFAVDLTANPTLAELLDQVRGERVQLEAADQISGVILGVEKRKEKVDDEVIEVDVLNLLTDGGLQAVKLDTVSRIKLLNEKLDAELRKALALLATAHATDKKAVTLDFLGDGRRRARVGYIQETPVWKTSYRLVMDEEAAPLLQGWAIVENTTEQDWSGVDLTLVSGRPISFVMDLYQPLYVPRPVVRPKLYASLVPRTYGQDLARREALFRAAGAEPPASAPADRPAVEAEEGVARKKELQRRGRALAAGRFVANMVEEDKADATWNLKQGVQSAATAGDVGELFQYAIATPVTLPRQQSAMLPIVNEEVKGEKLSIYNPSVHAKHPLNGLRLTNSTKLHLMQGPITVFDGGVYAGDAQIEALPPGSGRLISYAMDLDTEVAPESKGRPEQLLSVRLVKGTMYVTRKHARSQEYVVKNSGRKAKKVLIEHPYDPSWKLVAPEKPAEKTRDMYRFAVEASPGEPAKLVIEEERTDSQQVALTNIDEGAIRIYLSAKVISEKVKAALSEIVKRKHELGKVSLKRSQLEKRIDEIGKEQNRIRENMGRLDRNSDLYKRYVKKFADQEDEIERLRGDILELTGQETEMKKSLDEYLMGLNLQ